MKTAFFLTIFISLCMMTGMLFGVSYMAIPMDGYFYDPLFTGLKPEFAAEKGMITEVLEANLFTIQFTEPLRRTVRIRLIGTDVEGLTPEHLSYAREFSANALLNKEVKLSYDWNPRNEKGELLGYVWLPISVPGRSIYVLWNLALVFNGYSFVSDDPFRTDYHALFHDVQVHSFARKLGLFKEVATTPPYDWERLPETARSQIVRNTYRGLFLQIPSSKIEWDEDEWILIDSFADVGWRVQDEQGRFETVQRREYRIEFPDSIGMIRWTIQPTTRFWGWDYDAGRNLTLLLVDRGRNVSYNLVQTEADLPVQTTNERGEMVTTRGNPVTGQFDIKTPGVYDFVIIGPNSLTVGIFIPKYSE